MNTTLQIEKEAGQLWDYLEDTEIATLDELQLVTSINGMSLDSLESILYVRTGYRSLEQYIDCEGDHA